MKKHFKIVLATLLLAVFAVGFSSFKAESFNNKAFAQVCFQLDGDPDTDASWENDGTSTTCPTGAVFCGICFDNAFLTPGGKPNEQIQDAFANYSSLNHGATYQIPNTSIVVTVYRKAQ